MIEVRVLEFDRLGKAYVFDPNTLNVYETESIEGNPYSIYDKKGDNALAVVTFSSMLVFLVIFDIIYKINTMIAIIGYMLLLIVEIWSAGFTAHQDKYFYDMKDLKLIDKYKNSFLIVRFIKNILENHKKLFLLNMCTSVGFIAFIFICILDYDYGRIPGALLIAVVDWAILLFNNEWKRKKDLKKLLASLEQN